MIMKSNKYNISYFVNLAEKNTDEAWEIIDRELVKHCDDAEILDWASKNILSENSALADLSASILELAEIKLSKQEVSDLILLMNSTDLENPYPSFRAACALAKHKDNLLITNCVLDSVESKLKEFGDDESVSKVVRVYLRYLNSKK